MNEPLAARNGGTGGQGGKGTESQRKKPKARSLKREDKRQRAESKINASHNRTAEASNTPHFLTIGKIVAAQGLKGEVRVYPESDFPERFLEPGTRWLQRSPTTNPEPIELVRGRYLEGKGLYVMQFAGVHDRTQAEALQDCPLLVPDSDRPPLEEGEFHVLDLIGLEVFDQTTQALVGTVIGVIPAGNDLLEVQRAGQAPDEKPMPPLLIPFVAAIVPVVDLHERRVEITPPPGLIE